MSQQEVVSMLALTRFEALEMVYLIHAHYEPKNDTNSFVLNIGFNFSSYNRTSTERSVFESNFVIIPRMVGISAGTVHFGASHSDDDKSTRIAGLLMHRFGSFAPFTFFQRPKLLQFNHGRASIFQPCQFVFCERSRSCYHWWRKWYVPRSTS